MALQVRPRGSVAVRSVNGRSRAVVVRAHCNNATQAPSPRAVSASLLAAAVLTFNVAPALGPADLLQSARADEEVSEEQLTPYQRRQRELERRREMLRQTREQAEMKAGGEVAAPSTAAADAAVEAANAERRAAASQLGSELKSSAAAAYESATSSSARYRNLSGYSASPAPAPAAEPAPAPTTSFFSTPKPEPVAEVKKAAPPPAQKAEEPKKEQQQPATDKKQKRRGPLPLFAAQLLVLGGYAGLALAVSKYERESKQALVLAAEKGKELYAAAEQALAKASQQVAK